jgi:hypothetical protein
MPIEMEDLDDMAQFENQGKPRMPQQYVRPGRGVPGYTGDVEVYDPKRVEKPKHVKNISGTKSKGAPAEDK